MADIDGNDPRGPAGPLPTDSGGVIARVSDFCGRNRFFVYLFAALLTALGLWSAKQTPLDALPDLSDTQVIIATEWMGRNPTLIEDQITYPITTTFLGALKVKAVRGFTMFGMSFVYVIFEDGTDLYWARSRVIEYLSKVSAQLPTGVTPQIGPDATSVGWVYQYALRDPSGQHDLQELRSLQDWTLRFALQSVDGVAEVASVGGFEKQYLVEIDPVRMKAYGLSVGQVAGAIRGANAEVGGRVIELAQHEYALRGRGYIKDKHDIEAAVVSTNQRGTPLRVGDVATVSIGGNIRRGVAELDGTGEVVGGIIVMRYGENALDVIERVKAKIVELTPSLPPGVELIPVYDRSQLIVDSVKTLSSNLLMILGVVVLVTAVFLFHLRSALVAALTLPIATISSFIAFYSLDISINIMSLAGIILALGDMVDSAVVLVENAHKRIEAAERAGLEVPRIEIVLGAVRELGSSMFGALLVLTIAFLPVFTLEGEEGRLFRPLALAKTFSMAFAALFSITLVPALMVTFLKGRIVSEARNPINRLCIAAYRPLLQFCLRFRYAVVGAAVALLALTVWPLLRLGSEFMPPLYEGDLLYMPISVPGISIQEAGRLLRTLDGEIAQVPEVKRVFGKTGRAETSLDPAPLSMFEIVVQLQPKDQWRAGVTQESLIAELERRTQTPGLQGAWTMPIKARIDMLSTGIRTPIGIKVFGKDLAEISRINDQLETVIAAVPGTRSVYAERELGGFFVDFTPQRDIIARYGLSVRDVLDVVESSIGGMDVDTTIEGRERYKINVRYPREFRDNLEALRSVLVPIPGLASQRLPAPGASGAMGSTGSSTSGPGMSGPAMGGTGMASSTMGPSPLAAVVAALPSAGPAMDGSGMGSPSSLTRMGGASGSAFVPLGELASIEPVMGAAMIKSEMGSLTGWVYVDITGRDVGSYVDDAKAAVAKAVQLPPGYTLKWTGQYELLERVRGRLRFVLPLTLGLVFVILYLNFRGVAQTLIVMLGLPFAAVGAIWLLYFAAFNTSIAVWVGMIALLGVAAETASVMVVYLDGAWKSGRESGRIVDVPSLIRASVDAGSQRVRPLLMTVMTNIFGLLPVLVDQGVGSDVAKRIAAPMWGGLLSLTLLTLLVVPAVYVIWRSFEMRRPRALSGVASRT
jgi:Cu(I)/Ag(I) efflux system membrane protein CusA/SilA